MHLKEFHGFIDTINRTAQLNSIGDKVVPVNFGLGSHCTQKEFAIHDGMSGIFYIKHCDILNNNVVKELVNIDTIDNYVEKNNLNVGLIKIDVEGM